MPASSKARSPITQRQPIRYHAQQCRRRVGCLSIPTSFGPVLGPMDDYYIGEGTHLRLFDKLGAHAIEHRGRRRHAFRRLGAQCPARLGGRRVQRLGRPPPSDARPPRHRHLGSVHSRRSAPGTLYKFEIIGPDGELLPLKADPFAFGSRSCGRRPPRSSPIRRRSTGATQSYIERLRARRIRGATPMSIYEVHLGSWQRRADGSVPDLGRAGRAADPLCRRHGLHPYRVPADHRASLRSELGLPADRPLRADGALRRSGRLRPLRRCARTRPALGVILDWVPAHFPTDEHGLAHFDGTALYEHADPRQGFHPDWNTAIYNFGRTRGGRPSSSTTRCSGSRNSISTGCASMPWPRCSTSTIRARPGEWMPNEYGGRENLEAVAFLQRDEHARSTARIPASSRSPRNRPPGRACRAPVYDGGLGFGFKWNMGFMHDTLRYMAREPIHRKLPPQRHDLRPALRLHREFRAAAEP